jgi:predicted DNA-binding protein
MSRTVSFRCSEELDEFLEAEAERRMTTKSTIAQMIVADYAQESDLSLLSETGESGRQETLEGVNESKDALDRNPDAWYEPGGKYDYAVHVPKGAGTTDAGTARYYKTRSGAADGVERWYE